jgi:hypothetical protein
MLLISISTLVGCLGLANGVLLLLQIFLVAFNWFATILGAACIFINCFGFLGPLNDNGVPSYTKKSFWILNTVGGIGAAISWIWNFLAVSIAIGIFVRAPELLVLFFDLMFTVPGLAVSIACVVFCKKALNTCQTYTAIK